MKVKHQAVFTPFGLQVQTGSDQSQQGFVALDLPGLQRRGQSLVCQLVPAVAQACGAGHPQNHLQVAQAAGRLFAVGLQGVRGVVKFGVALVHFQGLGHQKGLRVQGRLKLLLEFGEQFGVACDPARLQQRGLHCDVLGRFGQALVQAAHAGANFQARVPAAANEALKLPLQRGVALRGLARGQQNQHIHIRVREQLGSAKTARRHQRQLGGETCVLPQLDQQAIGQDGQLLERLFEAPHGRAAVGQDLQHGGLVALVSLAQR